MKVWEEELFKAADAHGREKAHPEIRSMYPSESRSVMALHFQRSFEAGVKWVKEQAKSQGSACKHPNEEEWAEGESLDDASKRFGLSKEVLLASKHWEFGDWGCTHNAMCFADHVLKNHKP